MEWQADFADGSSSNVAGLTLRFGGVKLQARVYWPRSDTAPSISVVLASRRDLASADSLARGLCAAVGSIVLTVPADARLDERHELATLEWAAEHAGELGADPGRLVVGGHLDGGARAARLAIHAASSGWPRLARQVAVHPAFTPLQPLPTETAFAPPATIVTTGERTDGGCRYAASLRQSGIEVDELRHPLDALLDENRAELLADLARSVRRSP